MDSPFQAYGTDMSYTDSLAQLLGSFDLDHLDGREGSLDLRNLLHTVDHPVDKAPVPNGVLPAAAATRPRQAARPNPVEAIYEVPAAAEASHQHGMAVERAPSHSKGAASAGRNPAERMSKADRIREKNRLAQARFRQKQRQQVEALEHHVATTQARLEDARQRCLAARKTRHNLSSRLSKASDALVGLSKCHEADVPTAPAATHSTSTSFGDSAGHALGTTASFRLQAALSDSDPSSSAGAIIHFSRFSKARERDRPRAIESFSHFAPVSCYDCRSTAVSQNTSTDWHFNFGSFVRSYKGQKAASLGAPPSEVCWFVQTDYVLPNGQPLSLSSCLGSYACYLSLVLFYCAAHLEFSFLDEEMKLLDDGSLEEMDACSPGPAGSPGVRSPTHSNASPANSGGGRNSSGGGSGSGQPEPRLSKRARRSQSCIVSCGLAERPMVDTRDQYAQSINLRCGVQVEVALCEAVPHLMTEILQKYRQTLPTEAWVANCNRFLSFIDQLAGRNPNDSTDDNDSHCEGSGVDSGGRRTAAGTGEQLHGFPRAVAVAFQLIANTIVSVAGGVQQDDFRPSLTDARRQEALTRGADVGIMWTFAWCLLLHDSPRTARELAVDFCGPSHITFEQIEESHFQLYKSMHFSLEQRKFYSTLWREWQRRRRMLDSELESALIKLESLPSVDDINDSLIVLVSATCSGTDSAAVAAAADAPKSSSDYALWARAFLGGSPVATSTGNEAVKMLREVHERDSRMHVDTIALFVEPGWFYTPKQKTRFHAAPVSYLCTPVDILIIFQTAAFQQRRDELYHCTSRRRDLAQTALCR